MQLTYCTPYVIPGMIPECIRAVSVFDDRNLLPEAKETKRKGKSGKMSRLSVVLPAYNEEQMLAKTCRTLKKILDLAEINYELVIVDDGSTDQDMENN